LGFWAVSAAASVSFGPIIGGYLVDNFSWELIFYVNVPVGIAALFVTYIVQEEYKSREHKKFDMLGFISVTVFLPLMLYALSEGNATTNAGGWTSPNILIVFAISMIALAVFITTELTVRQPLIDLRLLMNHNFGIANIIMLIFSIGVFGGIFLLPLYLQNALGYTALQSGMVFLPVGIIQGLVAPLSGIAADRINVKIPIILGILLFTVSFLIFTRLSFLTEHHTIMISLYMRGLGMGLLFAPLSHIALMEIPRVKMAQASSLMNTIRQLGASLGIALLATVLSSRISFHTQHYGQAIQTHSEAYRTTIRNLSYSLQHRSGSTPSEAMEQGRYILLSGIRNQAYIQGVNDDFMLAAVITVTGIIPIFFLRSRKKK
jgi:DHA2 family multidrug resistance protein